jgi:hypothetical protein
MNKNGTNKKRARDEKGTGSLSSLIGKDNNPQQVEGELPVRQVLGSRECISNQSTGSFWNLSVLGRILWQVANAMSKVLRVESLVTTVIDGN